MITPQNHILFVVIPKFSDLNQYWIINKFYKFPVNS